MLWPVRKWGIEFYRTNPLIQATIQEAEAELDAELREEFPEFYTEKQGDGGEEELANAAAPAPAADLEER